MTPETRPRGLSSFLSFFHRGRAIFCYHDLYGFILEMDRGVFDLLSRFAAPGGRTLDDVRREAASLFRPEVLDQFLHTLEAYRCIVEPGVDEEAEALGAYPVRGPWVVRYAPRPDEVVIGYKDRRLDRVTLGWLDPIEQRLFLYADGEHTVREIIARIRDEVLRPDVPARVRESLFRWTHSDAQVMKLATRPIFGLQDQPPYLRSTMPYPRFDPASPPPADAEDPEATDLAGYHRKGIEDAARQFEVQETTLSHMLRVPHPALRGRTYGGAFAEALLDRGALKPGARILEVGGGVGFFARGFLAALPADLAATVSYTILDLSLVLQDAQRMLNLGQRIRFVLGHALASPFRDRRFDVVVSNEVVADLDTVRVRREDVLGAPPADANPARVRAAALLRRTGLPLEDAPEEFHANLGAMEFVEDLRRMLLPGGQAFIVEYGDTRGFPVWSSHLDHAEFSIQFAHLAHVAERAGFAARVADVVEFLKMDPEVKVLEATRTSFEILQALARRRGVEIAKIAYTEEMLRETLKGRLDLAALEPLTFRPVGERALSLRPREFKVLALALPLDGAAKAR